MSFTLWSAQMKLFGRKNVKVNADANGTLSSKVTVEAAQTDANTVDNTDTETTEIIPTSGGGSLSLTPLLLLLPLWTRRRWLG